MTADRDETGVIDRGTWPTRLRARVVEGGPSPRVLGFAVSDDLLPNYSFAETFLLTLVGDLPDRDVGRAFELALAVGGVVGAGEAPAHAAGLASLCAADGKNVVGVGAMALSQRCAWILEHHAALLGWFEDPSVPFPTDAIATGEEPLVSALHTALPERFQRLAVFAHHPTITAATLATLWACGLRQPNQMLAALSLAGLPLVWAEAFAVPPMSVRDYPMNTPAFDYLEDPRDDDNPDARRPR